MNDRGEVLWAPDTTAWTATAAGRFARHHGFDRYEDLHRWSVTDLEGFWAAIAAWFEVVWRSPPERVLADGDDDRCPAPAGSRGGTLNYAEHAARDTPPPTRDDVAVVARSQTRDAMSPHVAASWLDAGRPVRGRPAPPRRRSAATGSPPTPRTSPRPSSPSSPPPRSGRSGRAALRSSARAASSTARPRSSPSSCSPSTATGTASKAIDRADEVAAIRAALPSLRARRRPPLPRHRLPDGTLVRSPRRTADPGRRRSRRSPFDHPLYVLFSSGTTGLPKAIVHGHGGITARAPQGALALHQDLGPGDRFAWFTTTGWMMWNYLVSGLLVGATVVLFDGDPGHPDLDTLWHLAADTG